MTAACVMILITTIIGRLFNSIMDLLSALVGKSEEHCVRNVVRGFYLLVHTLPSAARMYRLGMTSSGLLQQVPASASAHKAFVKRRCF